MNKYLIALFIGFSCCAVEKVDPELTYAECLGDLTRRVEEPVIVEISDEEIEAVFSTPCDDIAAAYDDTMANGVIFNAVAN